MCYSVQSITKIWDGLLHPTIRPLGIISFSIRSSVSVRHDYILILSCIFILYYYDLLLMLKSYDTPRCSMSFLAIWHSPSFSLLHPRHYAIFKVSYQFFVFFNSVAFHPYRITCILCDELYEVLHFRLSSLRFPDHFYLLADSSAGIDY